MEGKEGGVCIYLRTNLNFRIRDDLNNDNLKCLFVKISMPRRTGFLVGTWYRSPVSPIELFNEFEKLVDKIDAENKETTALIWFSLTNSFDIYGHSQLITEPTRITQVSKSLIDLCITNSPEKVLNFGIVHLGVSYRHSLVFMTRKASQRLSHDRNATIQKLSKR